VVSKVDVQGEPVRAGSVRNHIRLKLGKCVTIAYGGTMFASLSYEATKDFTG
jgi:hypothetical protein